MSTTNLSLKQVASQIGTNIGTLIQMRAKGAKLFDPTFPKMTNGTFNAAEITAWMAAKSGPLPVSGAASPPTLPNTTSASQGEKP